MKKHLKKYPKIGIILLSFIAFIALGMPDGLLGVALPSIKKDFNIPLDFVGTLLLASVTGYLTSSFFSGPLITRFGVSKILAVSCFITGISLIGFTLISTWSQLVIIGVLAGLGAGAIDAGLNSYVASHFNENLMQWLHASYSIGITLGPLIMTMSLTNFHSWRLGYNLVALFQFLLGLSFLFTYSMWSNKDELHSTIKENKFTDYEASIFKTLTQSKVWISILLFYFYTGAEVTLGIWAYTLLTESRGIMPEVAGIWAGSFWATFTIGRIAAGLYAKRVGVNLLIFGGLFLALTGSILLWLNLSQIISLISIALIGLAIAPVFPALMSGTTNRVGIYFTANTIGFQMASASLGFATIPGFVGVIANKISLEIIPVSLIILFVILLLLYAIILRYDKAQISLP